MDPAWTSPDGKIELYLGDFLEVLRKTNAKADALITDPPYGLGNRWRGGTSHWPLANNGEETEWDATTASGVEALAAQYFDAVIWGGHLYDLPPKRGWLLWDKLQSGSFTSGHAELAWTTFDQPIRAFRMSQGAAHSTMEKQHPTQKPVQLMEWCMTFLPCAELSVLDPFMGSGTTAIACIRQERPFLGIEINERYFDLAVSRIEAELSRHPLFSRESTP